MRVLKVAFVIVCLLAAAVLIIFYAFPQQTSSFFYTVIHLHQAPAAASAPLAVRTDSTPAPPAASPAPPAASPEPPAPRGAAAGYLRNSEPLQMKGLTPSAQVVCRGVTYEKCYSLADYSFVAVPDLGHNAAGGLIEFNLQGNKQALEYGFGFDDNHPSDPGGKKIAEIRVIADGQVIDGPIQSTPSEAPLFRSIAVPGVFKLMLLVTVTDTDLHPLIIDPVVR